jgi:hypothetical protein
MKHRARYILCVCCLASRSHCSCGSPELCMVGMKLVDPCVCISSS